MEHRKSRFLFWLEFLGTLVVLGTVLISTGRLQQVLVDTKLNQEKQESGMLRQESKLVNIEMNQQLLRMTDSTMLMAVRDLAAEVRDIKRRTTRIEWKIGLPPIELETPQSSKSEKMRPFSKNIK